MKRLNLKVEQMKRHVSVIICLVIIFLTSGCSKVIKITDEYIEAKISGTTHRYKLKWFHMVRSTRGAERVLWKIIQ